MSKGSRTTLGILTIVILIIFIGLYSMPIEEHISLEPINGYGLGKQKATESDIVVMKAFSGQVISDSN
jgi:hypothetical protein